MLVLIDKLDDVVRDARRMALSDQVQIDREERCGILGGARDNSEEIKRLAGSSRRAQRCSPRPSARSNQICWARPQQAVQEASQTSVVDFAERQAQDIIDESRRQARETKLEMEDWADNILSTLEVNLEKFLTAIRRGRERLHERSQETVVAGVAEATAEEDSQL